MKEGWEYKEFEDCLVKAAKAKQVKTSDYNAGSKYPIISQEDKMISGYCDDSSLLYHIDCPVVIFGDHTRVLKYVDFDFVVGADGVKILVPKDFLNARFLLYYLQWYKVPSLGYSRHYKLLKEINLPIPPLAEQERIVAELDLLSSIIEKKKAQLKELDQLAQSIFYDMFGDPITNEKGWEVKTIGDTCNITCGQDYKSVKDDNGQYPIYGTGGIMGWANQYRCPKHSVIIGRKGNINNPILVDVDFWNVDTAFGITPKNEELKVVYFFFFCKEYDFTKHDVSVTIPSLRRIDVLKIKLPLPPLPLQQEFADKVEAIERQKSLIQQSIDEVQTLFDSRMDYWFG